LAYVLDSPSITRVIVAPEGGEIVHDARDGNPVREIV